MNNPLDKQKTAREQILWTWVSHELSCSSKNQAISVQHTKYLDMDGMRLFTFPYRGTVPSTWFQLIESYFWFGREFVSADQKFVLGLTVCMAAKGPPLLPRKPPKVWGSYDKP